MKNKDQQKNKFPKQNKPMILAITNGDNEPLQKFKDKNKKVKPEKPIS